MTRTRSSERTARQRLWPALAVLMLGLSARVAAGQSPGPGRLSFKEPEASAAPPTLTFAPAAAPALTEPRPLPTLPQPPLLELPAGAEDEPAHEDPDVVQAGCATCGDGGGVLGLRGPGLFSGCGSGCGGGKCIPGREQCSPCCHDGLVGRFLCGLYDCICCPDPCYEPRWIPIADSAFFCDAVRPITQTRIRWDSGLNVVVPDRAEYFWARADGMGKGPKPVAPFAAETRLKYNDLSFYQEVAAAKVSFFVEMPYRSLDPDNVAHAAGFGDMNLGTKSLIFDCELLQVAFQFRTYMPVGNATKGLGNGHVTLEPSLIVGLRIAQDTYLQTQIAEWIPIAGDPTYAGAILHYHASLNQVLARILPDVPLIGTVEGAGYSFQDGAYTDPYRGPYQGASDSSYFYLGAGLRLFVRNRIDFGLGVNFALTQQHWADQLYRTEFRMRF